jgi:hypothetical protein
MLHSVKSDAAAAAAITYCVKLSLQNALEPGIMNKPGFMALLKKVQCLIPVYLAGGFRLMIQEKLNEITAAHIEAYLVWRI